MVLKSVRQVVFEVTWNFLSRKIASFLVRESQSGVGNKVDAKKIIGLIFKAAKIVSIKLQIMNICIKTGKFCLVDVFIHSMTLLQYEVSSKNDT